MNKNQRKISKGNFFMAVFVTVMILLSFGISIMSYQKLDMRTYENQVRLLTAENNLQLEKGIYEKWDYPYMVFDLSGKVLYSDNTVSAKKGDFINVQEELGMDASFGKSKQGIMKKGFVLQNNEEVNGFVVYYIPQKILLGRDINKKILSCFIPACIGVILAVVLLFGRLLYFNCFVLNPIRQIAISAKYIIKGNYEYEFRRVFNKEVNANEIGELIYSFELMRDELKAKQIREEKLKKSQQELISCISHDLKTPISTIKAYAEGMRDGIARDENARSSFIRIIIEKTNLLISMIEDLLRISNAQLNELEIYRKDIYFINFFERAMNEIEGYVRQQGMEFSYSIELEECLVCIDERRILEVLYNLVENSIKYRKEDGKIQMIASRQNNGVLIQVRDNGMGISSDDIPYVFDKFYRAEKSRSSSIPGSGLGLSICKYIVEKHGGTIYCKSRKEKGCEIGFTLF